MIRTRPKPTPPGRFVSKQKEWTDRWTQNPNKSWATKRAIELIREGLLPMAHGKCFFCESILNRSSYCEIEHFLPKSTFPESAFDWQNLQISCRICNNSKSATPGVSTPIRPDLEEVENYFWLNFEGEIEPHPNLNSIDILRAQHTIKIYKLNRSALCEIRLELRSQVGRWIDRAQNGNDLLLEAELELFFKPSHEYKFVIRFVWLQAGLLEFLAQDKVRFHATT